MVRVNIRIHFTSRRKRSIKVCLRRQYDRVHCSSFRSPDPIIFFAEDHLAQISSMKEGRYAKPFREQVDLWERSITRVAELCDGLLTVQRLWLYMEGIFLTDDVQRQLTGETAEFRSIDSIWHDEILAKIRQEPNALLVASQLSK
jgi:hypothetical protein